MIFQISKEDIERSSTLTRRDLGKWACVIQCCIQILPRVQSHEDAVRSYHEITRK
jgi:hypothetical protein